MREQSRDCHRHEHDTKYGNNDDAETVRHGEIVMEFNKEIVPRRLQLAHEFTGLIQHEYAIVPTSHKPGPVFPRRIHVEMRRFGIALEHFFGSRLHHGWRNFVHRRSARLLPPFQLVLKHGNRATHTDDKQQSADYQPHDRVRRQGGINTFT